MQNCLAEKAFSPNLTLKLYEQLWFGLCVHTCRICEPQGLSIPGKFRKLPLMTAYFHSVYLFLSESTVKIVDFTA